MQQKHRDYFRNKPSAFQIVYHAKHNSSLPLEESEACEALKVTTATVKFKASSTPA
jgi:hypothetical protein